MSILCRFLVLMAFFFPLTIFAGRDHATIYGPRDSLARHDRVLDKIGFDREDYCHHEEAAERYKDKYFRDENTGQISLEKTNAYIQKLFKEYEINKKRIQETEFIEILEISKSHANKAVEKSIKAHINNNILDPYDLYLMPKLLEMITAIKSNDENNKIEGLLDDFIRGYIPYFNPNPFNNLFKTRLNFAGALYRVVKFPKYKKITNKIQANNLLVEHGQKIDINNILKSAGIVKKCGEFLNNQEISILLAHGYDISKLNPGESALWRMQTKVEKKHMYDKDPVYYPSPETKKTFDHVMLGGANSDKIKLTYFDKNGHERDVKLKIGDEVHLELASSALMRLIGFHADPMTYAGNVTFFLKDKTFDNFEAEIRQKFGQRANVRYNYERGISDSGEMFITWRDTLYEARPESEIRIAPLDFGSWDLQNRREYRGIALAIAWLGINDLKADNTKTLLVKRDGLWIPEHRIHDLGVSLSSTLTFTGIDSVLSLPAPYGKVNQFESKFIKKKKDGVKVTWNDFVYQHRLYGSVTYYDLKWMARKIAALTKKDIKMAFNYSGMHKDVAHLYAIKTIKRRNNIVRLFELDKEFEIYDTPKLKNYSPKQYPTIINGEITKNAYEGKNLIPTRLRTWGSLVSSLIAGQSITFAEFSEELPSNSGGVAGQFQGGALSLEYNWAQEKTSFGPFGSALLQPGLKIIPSRKVIESPQHLNTSRIAKDGEIIRTNLPYMVDDQLKIVVAFAGGFGEVDQTPVNAQARIRLAEKTISHRHFAESIKEAWLSPYRIPQILVQGKEKFAAQQLQDLENVESYYSIGVNIDLVLESERVANGVALGASVRKFKHRLLYRDQFGKLHYLTDKIVKKNIYAGIYAAKFDLKFFDIAALDIGIAKEAFHGQVRDYVVGVSQNAGTESHDHEPHTKEQAQREIRALKKIKKSPDDSDISLNFSRDFEGGSSKKTLGLAFVFSRNRIENWGQIEDTFSDGQVRKLFQANIYSGKHIGKKNIYGYDEVTDIAVKNGKAKKTIVEVDIRSPQKFIITVNNKVFTRKTNRKGLLGIIKKLNARYSEIPNSDEDEEFFANLKLPEKEDQDVYRKIYAEIRSQVDGEYLLKKVREISIKDLEDLLEDFFKNNALAIKKQPQDDSYDHMLRSRLAISIDHIDKKKRVLKHFINIKNLIEKEPDEHTDWRSIWLESRDLVHELSSRYYGVHLLKGFLNINAGEEDINKGLLVYGEIRNILDYISMLERPYGHNANIRNTGNHWGNFIYGKDKVRAVQYFLKYEDPTNKVPVYSPLLINSVKILGLLEQGQPPNFNGEGI